MTSPIAHICLMLILGCTQIAVAAPARDEILVWMERQAGATTLDEPLGAIGANRLEVLKPYLSPGVFDEFDFPALEMEVEATQSYLPHAIYLGATASFRDQATLDDDGSLHNYTAGQPFSTEQIERSGPDEAGFMIAWNHIHRWQNRGYTTAELVMNYVEPSTSGAGGMLRDGFRGGGHITRYIAQSYFRVYLSHLAGLPESGYRVDAEDSTRLLWKDYLDTFEPFDVKGTRFVIERSLDPYEDDQVNSYLPTERRVRRLSAKERADSFMGSNYSLDDFEGFSGRVLDADWRYIGRKVVLQVANSRESIVKLHGPGSRLLLDRWQVRPCYVVESRPKWAGHPVSRRIIFFDMETWNANLALIFDRDDVLWKSIMTAYRRPEHAGPGAEPGDTVSRWTSSIAVDYAANNATVTRAVEPVEFPEFKASLIKRMFSVSSLTEGR